MAPWVRRNSSVMIEITLEVSEIDTLDKQTTYLVHSYDQKVDLVSPKDEFVVIAIIMDECNENG